MAGVEIITCTNEKGNDMYIESLHYKNIGPISELNIRFRKNEKNHPIPLIIVGKNGSGKSILLSNIVDAFYELAGKAYDNATETNGNGHQYYKIISPDQIQIGQNYLVANIYMQQANDRFEYLFKAGSLTFDEYENMCEGVVDSKLNWKDASNYKNVTVEKDKIPAIFEKSIVCFFGPNRYTKPSWMGGKYYFSEDVTAYSMRPRYARHLNNPITPTNLSELTLQWLFDIITDSRADLEKDDTNGYKIISPNRNDLELLSISRRNVEKVMSAILDEEVIFRMGNRSLGKRRFSILKKKDGTEVVPSLDALSTGQLALFNMFTTIIRYADVDDINLSHRLEEIEGIVVIDEIELHLHTKLQREILPRLLALFPKVQFIITSHAPLFLLGMREKFGDTGFDIIELPSGNKISVEQFSEFENAYQYFAKTTKYEKEIKAAIAEQKDKPLIITEGATDWKHMKAAYINLLHDSRCSSWLPDLKFDFLEYEPKNSPLSNCCKLEMSASHLKSMCEQYCLMEQPRKMIFIADADVKDIRNTLGQENAPYRSWGNNVYSMILPIPESRKATPEICIEHYYSDEQIKTEMECGGKKCRLYMGCEFDADGVSLDKKMFCNERNSCGREKIRIIDGHEKSPRVYFISDDEKTNVALSKMKFATAVLDKIPPFDKMDFSNFIPLFEIIRDILFD